jgi:transcriptional regulator with XRE-family HTH domain
MLLGEKLKKLRVEKNLSLRELGKLAHISHSFIADIESGRSNPSLSTLEAIAKALGTSVNYFLADEKEQLDAPAPADKEPALDDEQIKEIKEKFPNLFTLLARAKGPIPEILADQITDIAKTLLKEYLENEGKKDPEKGK